MKSKIQTWSDVYYVSSVLVYGFMLGRLMKVNADALSISWAAVSSITVMACFSSYCETYIGMSIHVLTLAACPLAIWSESAECQMVAVVYACTHTLAILHRMSRARCTI